MKRPPPPAGPPARDIVLARQVPSELGPMGLEAHPSTMRRDIEGALEQMQGYVAASTRATYVRLFVLFQRYCDSQSPAVSSLPADPVHVVAYLQSRASDCKYATLAAMLSAIVFTHKDAGHPSPVVLATERFMRSTRRKLGTARTKKTAATTDITQRLADQCVQDDPAGLRDRAILLLLFAGAFRRSELVALDWTEVEFSERQVAILLKRSKTDQEGRGFTKRIPAQPGSPYCPVAALRAWQAVRGEGMHVFTSFARSHLGGRLSDRAVADIVKDCAARAGFDASTFSGHSGRRGYATSAARAGRPNHEIRAQTGHQSDAMLSEYTEASKELPRGLL